MNMKKYILLLGFAMASVDCSASGVAAYGNAVAAFLQAGKGLMGLKAPVQEALKKAKEDLGVGGGAEKGAGGSGIIIIKYETLKFIPIKRSMFI